MIMLVRATLLLVTLAVGGQTAPAENTPLDRTARKAVIDQLVKELREGYVFPEVANRIEASIRERERTGAYDAVSEGRRFAELLTADLREIAKDQHLRVIHSPAVVPVLAVPSAENQRRETERQRAMLAQMNFGFEKVEMIGGNVAYLDFRAFGPPELMADTAAAAMAFVANADALIIDLRSNGGGSPEGVAFLASYLFGPDPVRLNDIFDRRSGETRQYWTLAHVPGKRLAARHVYVLTSSRTFSAAEDFAYALQILKRATVVGEVTRGGAHPVTVRRIGDHFSLNIPWGRSINYLTKSNWEGTGVKPDVAVPADQALARAHLLALETLATTVTDPAMADRLRREVERLKAQMAAPVADK